MSTPNPNGFKVREKAFRWKQRTLVREIEASWNRKIPSIASHLIIWLVLESLVVDLTEDLPLGFVSSLNRVIKEQDFKGYLDLGAKWGSPQMYESPSSYFAASLVLNFAKKFPGKVPNIDPMAAAINRFYDAERRCKLNNRRLLHFRRFDHTDLRPLSKRVHAHEIFHLARRKIQSWLGPVNEKALFGSVRFGPGGCVGLKRPFTTPYYKFATQNYTVSNGAYWYSIKHFPSNEGWMRALSQDNNLCQWEYNASCIPSETSYRLFDSRVTIANYNEVTFVPKNAKTHRAIAIEPHLNVVLQLCVGSFIKTCLARAGCDLKDQSRNQELAYIGSIQRGLKDPVTIDLEMASDTICVEIIRELLPSDWFELLWNLRCHTGKFKDDVFKWEKFSSMGNGFTFELESLIFLALAQSTADYLGTTEWFSDTFGPAFKYAYVSVYGDDIVVPKEVVDPLVEILNYSGFKINEDKSFTSGPFRESCGSDFYDGVNVRTFYLKRAMSQTCDLIHMHNGLRGSSLKLDSRFPLKGTLGLIRGMIPDVVRHHLLGPTATDDDAYIWVTPDECHSSKLVIWDSDHQNWLVPTIRRNSQTRSGLTSFRYLQFLYSNTDKSQVEEAVQKTDFTPRWDLKHKNAGGSSGDVVIAGGGEGSLSLSGEFSLTRIPVRRDPSRKTQFSP